MLHRLANLPDDGPDDAQEPDREAPFLADLDEQDWERLERHAARHRFSRGDAIIRQGETDRSLLIVLSGELAYVVADPAGDEHLLSVIEAPSLVGELSFFAPGPRSGTLLARSDGELLRLGFMEFEALAAASPSLARRVLLDAGRIVAMRLRRAVERAVE